MLLIPIVGVSLSSSFPYHDQVGAGLYATAAATDSLDGHIARNRKQVSELGKFLDPLADKLLVLAVLAILVGQGVIGAWVFIVVLAREFLITGLRTVAANQGVVIGASPWGKSKTATQNLMIGFLVLQRPFPMLNGAAQVVTLIAVVATVLSGIDYLWRYRRFVL